jgi:hypothetical protein
MPVARRPLPFPPRRARPVIGSVRTQVDYGNGPPRRSSAICSRWRPTPSSRSRRAVVLGALSPDADARWSEVAMEPAGACWTVRLAG